MTTMTLTGFATLDGTTRYRDRFKAVEPYHYMFTLPERSLKELLSLQSGVLTPIDKVSHRDSLANDLSSKLSHRH